MKRPLVARAQLDGVLAWTPSGARRVRDLIADARSLAPRLASRYVVNACIDRYRFAVGFAACLLSGRTSLQPASQSRETLRRIRERYGDVICLCDSDFDSGGLTRLEYPEWPQSGAEAIEAIPEIAVDHEAAILFTSGSTGAPQPHGKTWGKLVQNATAESHALGLEVRPCNIVATVPVQHAFGFESSFLLALQAGCALWSGRPFYPQDIASALDSVPRPRMLVTTPFHLSALLASRVALPAIDTVLSATAPLSRSLALEAEQRCGAPVLEIYGSTETGQIASRRTVEGDEWRLLSEVRLEKEGEAVFACGGHVEGRVALADRIELRGEAFVLRGRQADMVNIAGRRSSIGYLDAQIAAIPGVRDAAFFAPEAPREREIARLAAFVVAPGIAPEQILGALRERIDAIFLPRPLVPVERLPRDANGKLQRSALQALYEQHVARETFLWQVPDYPAACEGHFPGDPILPGVVVLDQAIAFAEKWLGRSASSWRIESAKFLRPVGPGSSLEFSLRPGSDASVEFVVRNGVSEVASGVMRPR